MHIALVILYARTRKPLAAIVTIAHEHTDHAARVSPASASETAVKPAALRQLDIHHVRLLDVPARSV